MYISIMIHTINPSVDENLWLKRLDIQLNDPKNSISVPKDDEPTNNKNIIIKLWELV